MSSGGPHNKSFVSQVLMVLRCQKLNLPLLFRKCTWKEACAPVGAPRKVGCKCLSWAQLPSLIPGSPCDPPPRVLHWHPRQGPNPQSHLLLDLNLHICEPNKPLSCIHSFHGCFLAVTEGYMQGVPPDSLCLPVAWLQT